MPPASPVLSPASPAYLRLVRSSGWYDLVVTAGFATPWTYALLHRLLSAGGDAAGLGAMPALTPMQTLYANLMGSVVVVWSVLRVVRPLPLHGLLDGTARALFSLWQAYALAHGGPGVLWPFLVLEVSFGVAQLAPWARARATGVRETCQDS
ncbi:hypothetical protein AV521_10110 [Streptomyces sp. IMTB 2501]|uniref:hypothetical protein n=1 Tax=Streptomyces sp. IMTB 2501 TaxID=1776340 RepID=UPI00096E2C34|nr:hypothetical protein [Streptomyces sp. IMTB 2501]OLZ72243.1 hypothetical protein AV521_10110 [Streptomyces sp. IMTB 2501]